MTPEKKRAEFLKKKGRNWIVWPWGRQTIEVVVEDGIRDAIFILKELAAQLRGSNYEPEYLGQVISVFSARAIDEVLQETAKLHLFNSAPQNADELRSFYEQLLKEYNDRVVKKVVDG